MAMDQSVLSLGVCSSCTSLKIEEHKNNTKTQECGIYSFSRIYCFLTPRNRHTKTSPNYSKIQNLGFLGFYITYSNKQGRSQEFFAENYETVSHIPIIIMEECSNFVPYFLFTKLQRSIMLLFLTQLTSFSPLIDYLIYGYLNKTQQSTIVFRFKNEESCVSESFFSFLYYLF